MMKNFLLLSIVIMIICSLVLSGCAGTTTTAPTTSVAPASSTSPVSQTSVPPTTSIAPTTPGTTTAASSQPIKIGLLVDYSGVGKMDQPFHENGIKAKLDEIGWQIAGRKIELIPADDAGDPLKGTEAVKKLIESDKVDVILGEIWGHVALAVAPLQAQSRTPTILVSGQPVEVIKAGGGAVFLMRGTFTGNAYYSGVYAYDDLGYRSAVVMYDDFVTGETFINGFTKPFTEKGGTIVQTVKPPLNTFDFASYLSNIKKADVLAMWLQPPELASFYKQYNQFGLKMPIIYTSDTADSEMWAGVGDYCIGTIGQHEYSPFINSTTNNQFVDMLKQKNVNGWPPVMSFQEAGYTAATVFLEAVKATNGDTSHEKIIEALKNINVDTPEGKISFGPNGVGIGDELIVKITKTGNRYDKEVLKTYPQVSRKAPWE